MLEIASISNEESDNNLIENGRMILKDDLYDHHWFFSGVIISSFIYLSDPDRHIDIKTFLSDSNNVSSDKTIAYINQTSQLSKPIDMIVNIMGFLSVEICMKADLPLEISENYKFESIKSFKEYVITDRYAQLGMYLHFASDIVLN